MKNAIIVGIVVAIVFGGGGFYAGMKYQESQRGARATFGSGQFGTGMMRAGGAGGMGFRTGGGFTTGQIIKKDDTSITVQMQDGSTKIVLVNPSTQVMKSASGSAADLTVGENVLVTGTSNSDGSVTAQNVQLRPATPPATASESQ